MFTGIVEAQAEVIRLDSTPEGAELELDVESDLTRGVEIGSSVAVSGCCLTVISAAASRLVFQVVPETLKRSSLADCGPGSHVNVERAIRADGRLDGHIVQGHIDGLGSVRKLERLPSGDVRMRISVPEGFGDDLVPKGSVAVDGVSLTISDLGPENFEVALIPHTLRETTLGRREIGDRVNLEADILGKYIRHYLRRHPLRFNDPG